MEINNFSSQNLYQSKTSSTKKVDEVNGGGILNTFERLIDKKSVSVLIPILIFIDYQIRYRLKMYFVSKLLKICSTATVTNVAM